MEENIPHTWLTSASVSEDGKHVNAGVVCTDGRRILKQLTPREALSLSLRIQQAAMEVLSREL